MIADWDAGHGVKGSRDGGPGDGLPFCAQRRCLFICLGISCRQECRKSQELRRGCLIGYDTGSTFRFRIRKLISRS
jgi:hypothetical protein